MAEEQADTNKTSSPPAEGYDEKCIFCRIVNRELGTELLHSDEEISCFKDIKPGAPHHYLVVPTKHVGNCKSLNKEHVPLVKQMVDVGKDVLQKNDATALTDARFGFHWPPFCSVTHLHLHVLAPVSQMGFMSRLVYRLNSYWFVTDYRFLSEASKVETKLVPIMQDNALQNSHLETATNADQLIELLSSKEETN